MKFDQFGLEYDFFFSYVHEDKEIVDTLFEVFKGHYSIWRDSEKLTLQDNIARNIRIGLDKADQGLVIITKNYLKRESHFAKMEIDTLEGLSIKRGENTILYVAFGVTVEEVAEKFNNPALYNTMLLLVNENNGTSIQEKCEYILNQIRLKYRLKLFQTEIVEKFAEATKIARKVTPKADSIFTTDYRKIAEFTGDKILEWVKTKKRPDNSFFQHLFRVMVYYNRIGNTKTAIKFAKIFEQNKNNENLDDDLSLLSSLEKVDIMRIAKYKKNEKRAKMTELLKESDDILNKIRKFEENSQKSSFNKIWSSYLLRAYTVSGILLRSQKFSDEANAAFNKAIEIYEEKKEPGLKIDNVYYEKGVDAIRQGKLDLAEELILKSEEYLNLYEEANSTPNHKGKGFISYAKAMICYFRSQHDEKEGFLHDSEIHFSRHFEIRRTSLTNYHLALHAIYDNENIKLVEKYFKRSKANERELSIEKRFQRQKKLIELRLKVLKKKITEKEIKTFINEKSEYFSDAYYLLPFDTYFAIADYCEKNEMPDLTKRLREAGNETMGEMKFA